jgi:hypothetical protein
MLAEAIEKLCSLHKLGVGPVFFKPEDEGAHGHYLRQPDGSYEWNPSLPVARDHKALSLQPVADLAKAAAEGELPEGEPCLIPVIWYSREAVVCLLDDSDRRDRVTLALAPSPQLAALIELEAKRQPVAQADLLFLLRTTFKGCCDTSLVPALRSVQWKVAQDSASNIDRSKRSVGKSIEQEVLGLGSVPETTTLAVPVFAAANLDALAHVECVVEPVLDKERFLFYPLPGQVESAWTAGEAWLLARLMALLGEDSPVSVHYGRP